MAAGALPVLTVDAPEQHFSVRIAGDQLTIGRGESNDIGLNLPQLSEHHAALRRRGQRWQLVDLNSDAGTTVEGQPVKEALLEDGESFELAGTVRATLSLHSRANGAAGAAASPNGDTPASETAESRDAAAEPVIPAPRVSAAAAKTWREAEPPREGASDAGPSDLRPVPHAPDAARIRLGRAATNDLVLGSSRVGLEHAEIERSGAGSPWTIRNLGIGETFVNNRSVHRRELADGDVIRIGPYRLEVRDGEIFYRDEAAGILVQALNLSRRIGKRTILHDVSLLIPPREFVAIVGVSGTGKTTLLNALSALKPATSGDVLLNGVSLYENFNALRSDIGYVPQDDIVHRELTVESALSYAAELRMPADTSKEERNARLDAVLGELGLEPHRGTTIGKLSGGQRKRVSIAVELLTEPPLFFLDEPTSGLDPVTASHMMDLLRRLADEGRTIVLVTHATRDISLCDRVVFLAQGGRLAFYGAPRDALQVFGTGEFEDIYDQIENRRTPEEWEEEYRSSAEYQQNVLTPLVRMQAATMPASGGQRPRRTGPDAGRPATGALRQFGILTRRYVATTLRDRKQLAVLLLQAPILAALLCALFNPNVFQPQKELQIFAWNGGTLTPIQRDAATGKLSGVPPGADLIATSGPDCAAIASGNRKQNADCHPASGNGNNTALKTAQLAFLLAAVAVWLGTLSAVREIAREHAIYRRERMVNLLIIPYIASKFAVLLALVVLQCALLLGVTAAYIHYPSGVLPGAYLSLLLGGAASVAVALAVSAAVSSPDRAVVAAPLIMVPQILFAGGLTPIQDLGAAKPISAIVTTRWCYEAIGRVFGVVKLAGIPQQFPQTPALSGQATLPWLIMAGFIPLFGVIAVVLQRFKDRR